MGVRNFLSAHILAVTRLSRFQTAGSLNCKTSDTLLVPLNFTAALKIASTVGERVRRYSRLVQTSVLRESGRGASGVPSRCWLTDSISSGGIDRRARPLRTSDTS